MERGRKNALFALMYFAVYLGCTGFLARTIDEVNIIEVQAVKADPGQVCSATSAVSTRTDDLGLRQDYTQCLPREAIQYDETTPYVLVVDERAGFFGVESYVRRVNVSLVAEDEDVAALNEGVLASDQEVVVASTRPVDDGDTVRVQDGKEQ